MEADKETAKAIESAVLELTNALRPMPPKDLVNVASQHFVDRYNELLAAAEKAIPGLQPFQWPKRIQGDGVAGRVRLVELQGYLGTILGNVRQALGVPRHGGF